MKAMIVLLILAAICAAVYFAAQWLQERAAIRSREDAEWHVVERTSKDGTHYTLFCVKEGEPAQQVGEPIYLGQSGWDFQEELAQRRTEARDRADFLNRKDQE